MNDAAMNDLLFTVRVLGIAFAVAWASRKLPTVKLTMPGRKCPVTWAETGIATVYVAGGLAVIGGIGWMVCRQFGLTQI